MTASTGEVFEHVIHKYTNPVTQSIIKLVPPAECMSQFEYDELIKQFAGFCLEAWKEKKDPETIDPRTFRSWEEDG